MAIIAINGKIGSGKDTVGKMIQYLTSEAGDKWTFSEYLERYELLGKIGYGYLPEWEIKKFAGKLKQIASLLSGIPIHKFEDQEFKKTELGPEWNYLIHDPYQGFITKRMTVREFLQKLGTEAMRDGLHTNTWVNALYSNYDSEYSKWIITDLRFPNELTSVIDRIGITIRVTRPGTQTGTHPSETALDEYPFKYEISNDSTYDDLLNKVKQILVKENIIS